MKRIPIFICLLFLFGNTLIPQGVPLNISATKGGVENSVIELPVEWDIIVPDDYATIQDAVDHASIGGSIFVRNGIYEENILINTKGLWIQGENKFTTTIDGGNRTDTIAICGPNVSIQGFTITQGWHENVTLWDLSGIRVLSSNVTINDNRIMANRLGINVVTPAHNLTISNNLFLDDGILFGNYLYSSMLSVKDFLHTVVNNTVNGKPLYYYKNTSDVLVPPDAGQIIIANCTNLTIRDLSFTHVDFPIIIGFCSHGLIENITVNDTWGELLFMHSDNLTIQQNTLSNMTHGICIDFGSTHNVIQQNTVLNNYVGISILTSSHTNKVSSNSIYDNDVGIEVLTYFNDLQTFGSTLSKNRVTNNTIGIFVSNASYHNVIQGNEISKNQIGLLLKDSSNNNTITDNNFQKNVRMNACFTACLTNYWEHNYWNGPRVFPKMIFGFTLLGRIPLPWINIDWHPAQIPNEV